MVLLKRPLALIGSVLLAVSAQPVQLEERYRASYEGQASVGAAAIGAIAATCTYGNSTASCIGVGITSVFITAMSSVKIQQDGTQLRRRAVEGLVHHTPSGIVHGYVDITQLTTEPHLVEHDNRHIWVSKTDSGRIKAYAPFDSASPAKRNLDDPGEINGVYLYYDTKDTQGSDDTNLSDIANQFANQLVDQQLSSLCVTIINSSRRVEMIGTLDLYGKDGSEDGNICNTPTK